MVLKMQHHSQVDVYEGVVALSCAAGSRVRCRRPSSARFDYHSRKQNDACRRGNPQTQTTQRRRSLPDAVHKSAQSHGDGLRLAADACPENRRSCGARGGGVSGGRVPTSILAPEIESF